MLEIQTSCLKLTANRLLLWLGESAPHPPPWLELITESSKNYLHVFQCSSWNIFFLSADLKRFKP